MSPVYVGGLRARLIADSVYIAVKDSLASLGWLAANRRHAPIVVVAREIDADAEVNFNTLAISATDTAEDELEMGSNWSENRWTFFVDFYAENDAIGRHVIYDVRDILLGKYPSIGRIRPVIEVFDWTLPNPEFLFYCGLEDVVVDRAHDFPNPWQKHWFSCRFDLLDAYGDEDDSIEDGPLPTEGLMGDTPIVNLAMEQGARFERTFSWRDAAGVPIPLAGYKARMQVRNRYGGTVLLDLDSDVGDGIELEPGNVTGDIKVVATASETNAMPSGGVYDLELTSLTDPDDVVRLVKGRVYLSKGVTE